MVVIKLLRWTFLSIIFLIKWLLALGLFITLFQHFITPVYKMADGKPFEGDILYNPYHQSDTSWLKMNLHAHSKAWGGVTDGMKQNNEEIFEAYTKLGYDIIGISNYHDPQQIYFKGAKDSLTVYEYGINLFKAHRLVVGTAPAKFREVTFFHNIHDRQYILNHAYSDSKVLIVAHPQFGKGHKLSDFSKLSNYHLIEVLNHYRYSEGEWDQALSHGKTVFIIGNDDMHDLGKPGEVNVRYTMVADRNDLADCMEELKKGNAYGVSSPDRNCFLQLKSCKVNGMNVEVSFDTLADKIEFITDRGVIRDSIKNVSVANYTIVPQDHYVRVIAYKGSCKLYLNPIIRTADGTVKPNVQSFEINWLMSILEKLFLLLLAFLLIKLLIISRIKF